MQNLTHSHSSFKNADFFTGNASTNHQLSVVIPTEGITVTSQQVDDLGRPYFNTMDGRFYGASVEECVIERLNVIKSYLGNNLRQKILERAIQGVKQSVYILRTFKTVKNRYGERSYERNVYAIFVIDDDGKVLNMDHKSNRVKTMDFVEDVVGLLCTKTIANKKYCAQT